MPEGEKVETKVEIDQLIIRTPVESNGQVVTPVICHPFNKLLKCK